MNFKSEQLMNVVFKFILVSTFIVACSDSESSEVPFQSELIDSSPMDIRSHAIYEYYDTVHLDPDSSKYVDRIHHIRFDSTDHVEIRTYSGCIIDPPTRFYVSFYADDNVALDSQYYFHAQSPSNKILSLNRQQLARYCLQYGKKTDISYPY